MPSDDEDPWYLRLPETLREPYEHASSALSQVTCVTNFAAYYDAERCRSNLPRNSALFAELFARALLELFTETASLSEALLTAGNLLIPSAHGPERFQDYISSNVHALVEVAAFAKFRHTYNAVVDALTAETNVGHYRIPDDEGEPWEFVGSLKLGIEDIVRHIGVAITAWRAPPAFSPDDANELECRLQQEVCRAFDRWTAIDGPRPGEGSEAIVPFVATRLQTSILNALKGRALKKEELARAIQLKDAARLYRPGALSELMERGIVANKHGVGYYRPDALPPNSWD